MTKHILRSAVVVILLSGTASESRGKTYNPGVLFSWQDQSRDSGVIDLEGGVVSDRPDFTEASSVVGLGVLQIEAGYTYAYDHDGGSGTKNHSYPEMLLRYGVIADWLEFRLASNYAGQETGPISSSGGEDLYLGLKIGLTTQDGCRPEMALVPQLTVPTGADSLTSGDVLPGLNWLYGWDLSEYISTAGSTQFNRAIDGDTGDTYTEWAVSWTFGYGLTDRVGAYTEWYALFPSGAMTEKSQHYFNGGFTLAISDDIQWDIRVGQGLNDAADDYFVGTGLVLRFR